MNPVEFPGGNPIQQGERRLFPNSPEAIPIPSGRGGFRHSELGSKILNIKNKRLLKSSIEFTINLVMVFLKRFTLLNSLRKDVLHICIAKRTGR